MAIIGLCSPRAAAWGSSTAVLTALGLADCGYPVEFLQMVSSASHLSFEEEAQLPFTYTAMVWEGTATYDSLLAAMDRARSERRHLVLDIPANPFDSVPSFVERLDLPLIPVRPGSAYLNAACNAAEAVLDILSMSKTPMAARPWLLPVGWTSAERALWQIKGVQEARAETAEADPAVTQVVPWTVPHLPPHVADAILDADTLAHTPTLRPVAVALARIALRLAADPGGSFGSGAELLGEAEGNASARPGDPRDLPQRLWELADDLVMIKSGRGPSQAELDAAPVLDGWHLEPEVGFVVVGRVEGHPVLGSRWIRTSQLFHFDELRSFARTLSRYYRLGRRRDEGEQ